MVFFHKLIVVSVTAGEQGCSGVAPHMATALLGVKLLVAAFDSSEVTREWLLKEVQGKLVGVKEETALPFVAVLSLLVRQHPKAVLQHAALLKVRSAQQRHLGWRTVLLC